MTKGAAEDDQKILARLRKPIDDLIDRHCVEWSNNQRVRFRQLAWQAVDVLVRTDNVAGIKKDKDIERIIRDIYQIGASEKFIRESLELAVSIYRQIQTDYPGLLKRYRGEK